MYKKLITSFFLTLALTSNAKPAAQAVLNWFNVNHKDIKGQTALHRAASNGATLRAQAILWLGADIEEHDNETRTALYYAAMYGNETGDNTCADMLITEYDADLNVLFEEEDLHSWLSKTIHRIALQQSQEQEQSQELEILEQSSDSENDDDSDHEPMSNCWYTTT